MLVFGATRFGSAAVEVAACGCRSTLAFGAGNNFGVEVSLTSRAAVLPTSRRGGATSYSSICGAYILNSSGNALTSFGKLKFTTLAAPTASCTEPNTP